jgi:hypothetical protein
MKTDNENTEANKPVKKTCKVIEDNHAYYRNRPKAEIPSHLKKIEDVLADLKEALRTSLGDQHLILKLRAKGYNISQKEARGEVGDFDRLKGHLYRIQITDRDEWGDYPKAWVIDIELQDVPEH